LLESEGTSAKRLFHQEKATSRDTQNATYELENSSREALIKPAFLRAESDHGVSPAGFLSVAEKDAE
jgi:hypothetical protein